MREPRNAESVESHVISRRGALGSFALAAAAAATFPARTAQAGFLAAYLNGAQSRILYDTV